MNKNNMLLIYNLLIIVIFIIIFYLINKLPSHGQITEKQLYKLNNDISKYGLANISRNIYLISGKYEDHICFQIDISTAMKWIVNSKPIDDAKFKTKPGRIAFIISRKNSTDICLIIVRTYNEKAVVFIKVFDEKNLKDNKSDNIRLNNLKDCNDNLEWNPYWINPISK
ncbi:MAG: hypothetical protein ACYC0V_05355 [Armatimonadota bacterium]